MHILLTNDDGIYAEGIYALYLELKKIGKVTVVAPDSERSSVGHGITLAHPIWYKKMNRRGIFFGYGITGTPADCVKFAISVILKKKPDLIVSGINFGPNDGCSVFYSGTVAGAREGALLGIPSLAISLASNLNPNFSFAAYCAAKLIRFFRKYPIPRGTLLNVNIPEGKAAAIKGVLITRQCTDPIQGVFYKRKDPQKREYYWMSGRSPVYKRNNSIDTYALRNRYVTVTPIHCDMTDHRFLDQSKHVSIGF